MCANHPLIVYFCNGDQDGSDPPIGVRTGRRLRPEISTEYSDEDPPAPCVSRENMITRPLGAHVGPSSRNDAVSSRSSDPSSAHHANVEPSLVLLGEGDRSPRGDQTGVP